MCAAIGIFVIAHVLSRYAQGGLLRNRVGSRIQAAMRYLSYQTLPGRAPSLGIAILILSGLIFFLGVFPTLLYIEK
jgi:hypothetical protein